MKKLLIFMTVTILFITGCGVAKMENGEDAVASLEDGKISINDLYETMKNDYALNVLIDLVDSKILEKVYPSDDDEKEYIDGQVQQLMYNQQLQAETYPTVDLYLQAYGVKNLNTYKEQVKLSYKREQAIEAYAKGLVTEKEIKKYYDEKAIGDIRASHILFKVTVDSDATTTEKENADKEAYDKAKSIIAELKAGKKFEDLAKEHSEDGSAEKGGDLDWFNRGSMVEEFEEAAIALKKGEYSSEPVKSEFGYHIILKTDEREKAKLDTIKETIIETLAAEKREDDENLSVKALIQLRKDHKIKIEDSELNKQYKNYLEKY